MNRLDPQCQLPKLWKIFFVFLIVTLAALSFDCTPRGERRPSSESTITVLCRNKTEQNVFRDGGAYQRLMFIPLVNWNAEGKPEPCLLESWEHQEDFREWTFHLRKDVRWHDEKRVTAHDVKFTLELLSDPRLLYEHRVFKDIAVIDDFTCIIRSDNPCDPLIYSYYGVLPKHLLEGLSIEDFYTWSFWKQPVGSGSFRYVRHIPMSMVELEANPYYFGETPRIKRAVLKFGNNPVTELMSESIDVVIDITPLEIMQVQNNVNYKIIHAFSSNRMFAIVWNSQNPTFQFPSVRKALTLAFNRKELIQLLNLPDETPVADVAFTGGQYIRGEMPPPLPYDPDLAGKLLDEAGWIRPETGGFRTKNGQEFIFSLLVSPDLTTCAVFIQDQLKKVGVRVNIGTMERNVLLQRRGRGEFEALVANLYPFEFNGDGGGHYNNPEFNRLLEAAYMTPTVEEFETAVRKLWPYYVDDMPFTFLFPATRFGVVHNRIQGMEDLGQVNPLSLLEELWIEEKK